MNNTITPQHKIGETVAYHLLPGVAILAVEKYAGIKKQFARSEVQS